MKNLLRTLVVILFFSLTISGCDGLGNSVDDIPCGYHNGSRLFRGPKGGCYYMNSNGNKTYVDRSECNC